MDMTVILITAAVVLAGLVVVVMTGRGGKRAAQPQVPIAELPPEKVVEIDGLVLGGRTIEAIKELRGATGLSLADAKAAVDAWGADAGGAPAAQTAASIVRPDGTGALDPALVAEVDREIAAGNTIKAIKVLRDGTGWGLKESKDRVDRWVPGRG